MADKRKRAGKRKGDNRTDISEAGSLKTGIFLLVSLEVVLLLAGLVVSSTNVSVSVMAESLARFMLWALAAPVASMAVMCLFFQPKTVELVEDKMSDRVGWFFFFAGWAAVLTGLCLAGMASGGVGRVLMIIPLVFLGLFSFISIFGILDFLNVWGYLRDRQAKQERYATAEADSRLRLEQSEKSLATLQTEITKTEATLGKGDEQRTQSELVQTEQELTQITRQIETAQRELAELEAKQERYLATEAELWKRRESLKESEVKLADLQSRIAKTTATLGEGDGQQTQNELRQTEQQLTQITRQIETAQRQLAELETQQTTLEKRRQDFAEAKRSLAESKAEITRLKKAIARDQEDLAKTEQTAANLGQQIESAEQRRARLEAENAAIEAELRAKKAELRSKEGELVDIKAHLETQQTTLKKRRQDFAETERSLAECKTAIARTERATEDLNNESAEFALIVDDAGQEFHEAVKQFLQSEKNRSEIMGQIGTLLRLHHADNGQILEALKQYEGSEPPDRGINTAIDLVDRIAENLGDLDRCLETLTRDLDEASDS